MAWMSSHFMLTTMLYERIDSPGPALGMHGSLCNFFEGCEELVEFLTAFNDRTSSIPTASEFHIGTSHLHSITLLETTDSIQSLLKRSGLLGFPPCQTSPGCPKPQMREDRCLKLLVWCIPANLCDPQKNCIALV